MYAAISRIYSAARRRLEAFITALPGSHDGCGGSRRGSHRHRQRRRWSSPFRTPLGSPMSMSSIIGAADEQATPASSGAAYATPQGETATPSVILASPLPPPQMVVVALDATRDHRDDEIKTAFRNLVERGDILRARDSLLVLGVLHSITHPSEDHLWNITTLGYQTKPFTESFVGTSDRYLLDQVANIAESYKNKLQQVIEMLHNVKITVTLKITPGAPAKVFIIHEVNSSKASWVVLDRHFRRDFKHLEKHIACKVATFQDHLQVQSLRSIRTNPSNKSTYELEDLQRFAVTMDLSSETVNGDTRKVSIRSSPVSYLASLNKHEIHETSSVAACSMPYFSGMSLTIDDMESLPNEKYEDKMSSQYDSSERPVLCIGCGLKSVLYIKESMKFPFSEIQTATSDFSSENLLGEGGFGHVYKGQLKDGQVIAAKVHKEASSQGYTEFFSEVQVLSFARHRNIVMLLGYCCKESYNILVYEYICNNSLEWHLFDKSASLLEWHKRYAIAIGIAKGLRFLHEECRAGPIIHRDLRPSNVLLTHDFVPMLGDFGLAKWKAGGDNIQTRILGQTGYLAPEYAQYGMVSVRTDVYAFGIVLFQLISGRKVLDDHGGQCTHILQWAEPLVESLALHELIDDRIKDTNDTYGLYHLAKIAYLCARPNPEQRPSMGEVVRLIEIETEHIRDLSRQFIPHFMK
ncbi:inactive protein kinase SELMODRAFT_444075 isoform X1 [Zea mays]|uniref:Protein kinase domain-containing protein n=1 Tax=Zea mays TaxID=4577 RepID=B8A2F1_MAIZE|nr:inactive protein kinase SELMODRAFT_444075-like isoform X1 [Zea mays]ACL54350.1 unknown [Zea mays]